MRTLNILFLILASLTLALTACSQNLVILSQQQAGAIAWQALEPNTNSHDQAAWKIVEIQSVKGQQVQSQFAGEPVPGGCAPGPKPPANGKIQPDSTYWQVQMKPQAATPRPMPSAQWSPTAPPFVPEPFVYQADFLIDPTTGQIVARKLRCVIY